MWLDLARYADTFGFEKDSGRTIWPWRDWVIRAFNDDMPFDRFTVRQLAGDLLPDATTDDLLATAFHRNTQNNAEGGTDDEEFRMATVAREIDSTRRSLNDDGHPLAVATDWKPAVITNAATTGGTLAVIGDGRLKAGGALPIDVRYDLDIDLPPGTTTLRIDIALDSGHDKAAPPERAAVLSHIAIEQPPAPKPVPVPIAEVFGDVVDGPFDPDSTVHPDAAGFGGYPAMDRPRRCVLVLGEPKKIATGGRVKISMVQAASSNSGFQACPLRHFQISVSTDPRWTALVSDTSRRERRERLDVRHWDRRDARRFRQFRRAAEPPGTA